MSYYFAGQHSSSKPIKQFVRQAKDNMRSEHKTSDHLLISFYYISNSLYRLLPLQNGTHLTNFLTNSDQNYNNVTKLTTCRHLSLVQFTCHFLLYHTMHIQSTFQHLQLLRRRKLQLFMKL